MDVLQSSQLIQSQWCKLTERLQILATHAANIENSIGLRLTIEQIPHNIFFVKVEEALNGIGIFLSEADWTQSDAQSLILNVILEYLREVNRQIQRPITEREVIFVD